MVGVSRIGVLAVALSGMACGNSTSRGDPPEPMVIVETPDGGYGGRGGAPMVLSGAPPWEDRCAGKPAIITAPLPSCQLGEETILDDLAVSRNAIALDAERVYYVGEPPAGVPCPDPNECTSVLSLPKVGGEVRVHGPGLFTNQIALDDQLVFWANPGLLASPKLGGELQRAKPGNSGGLIAAGGAVYTFDAGNPTAFARVKLPLGTLPAERMVDLPLVSLVPRTVVTDGEWAYFAQLQTSPAYPVYAVRLSDGELRLLASIDIAQGMALGGRNLYLSEEATASVMRIDVADGSISALCLGGGYPTTLAADDSHLYVNLETLTGSNYTGRLVRMGHDGSDPCVVASGLDYGSGAALDEEFVYWVAGRLLHKLPKR